MVDPLIEATKAVLRTGARAVRSRLSAETRAEATKAIAALFLETVVLAPREIVAAYWRIHDEVDCASILIGLMDRPQPVCLPVVLGDALPLEMRLWEPGAALYEAGFGTLAPAEAAPKVAPDVIITPLLGFDKRGTRLGYGGGYYDRTLTALAKKPRLIGLAFAAQELETIPREPHDVPLDMIVTEQGITSFSAL